MISDGERSDEDSRLDDNNHSNGDAKGETTASVKINPDDGDESSVASTSKDAKSQAKDRDNSSAGKSKTKKKKKGHAHQRLRYVIMWFELVFVSLQPSLQSKQVEL